MSGTKKAKKVEIASVAEPAVEPKQKLEGAVQEQTEPQGDVALNAVEETKLEQFETVLKPGLSSFITVGRALKAIRDEKLYRAKFATFDEYCRVRWDLSDKYAYRQIEAFTVVEHLSKNSPNGENRFPTNESQVRPLTSLEPAQQSKAWQKVLKLCAGKPITAIEVQAVVDKMGGSPPDETTTKPKTALKKAETKLQKIDKLVAEALEADDAELTVTTLKEVLEKIQKLLGKAK